MQILQNVLHSLTKRKKQAGKVTVTAAVAAVFIAVIVVSANGILSYQKAVTKKTFGGWFIMENSSNGTQSEELKTHPYLAGSGKAGVQGRGSSDGADACRQGGYSTGFIHGNHGAVGGGPGYLPIGSGPRQDRGFQLRLLLCF